MLTETVLDEVRMLWELASVTCRIDCLACLRAVLKIEAQQLAEQNSAIVTGPIIREVFGDRRLLAATSIALKRITLRVNFSPKFLFVVGSQLIYRAELTLIDQAYSLLIA